MDNTLSPHIFPLGGDVFIRVPVPTCSYSRSVQYSVDDLYRCTLSTSSAKSEQLSKALLHVHT